MNILEKNNTSSWMMKFAWTLEIILCLSGMLIAFTLSYIGITGEDKILSLDTKLILLVGTLPLIGVALTELLKIPLVTGFLYAKSWMIKSIAGIALTAICILTFETMLTGQEQLFSLRAEQIKVQKQDENRMVEGINLIDRQINSISKLTPVEIKKEANAGIQAQLTAINEQIDDLRNREESLVTSNNSAEVSELLRQVQQLEESKKVLVENHRITLKEINNEKLSLNSDEQNELENAGIFRKGGVENKFSERRATAIESFNSEIDSANRAIGKLNRKIAKLSEPTETLKTSLELIASQIIDLQNEKNEIIKSNNKQVELSVLEAKNSKAKISSLMMEKVELTEELNHIRDSLAIASGESFIHRLAAKYYGVENLADLTEEQVGNFALIFMCSVAGVVSLAGPLITFVAVSIRLQDEEKKPVNLLRSMRYVFVALIKRLRDPKIVKEIKEVEVEKEVIKEVEVEKIKYEEVTVPQPVEIPVVVQVPVPTDPKDLPKMEELTEDQLKPIQKAMGGLN
jgi:prefoldin subunit 5